MIIWDIYTEHLDEAEFIWTQWERSLAAANYTIAEVADGPEERLLAHLDALVIGGAPVADELLVPALEAEEPSRASAAAWALLQAEHADLFEPVWRALLAATGPGRIAIGRAFELATRSDLVDRLLPHLSRHGPEVDAVVIDAVAAHSPARLGRSELRPVGAGTPAMLLGALLRAAQSRPDTGYEPLIEQGLRSEDAQTRAAAIEAGMLLGAPSLRAACRQVVVERGAELRLALSVLETLSDPRDHQRLQEWAAQPELASVALWARAFAGRPVDAEQLLTHLDDPALAPIAADSFGAITGLVIEGPFAKVAAAEPAEGGVADEGLADDAPVPLVLPEQDLLMPDAGAVRDWWRDHRARFDPNERYVYGQRRHEAALLASLSAAPTWRRRGLRLGLSAAEAAKINPRDWARHRAHAASLSRHRSAGAQ